MRYDEIIKKIAAQNNTSEKHVEAEMQRALNIANIKCSPKAFIELVSKSLCDRL